MNKEEMLDHFAVHAMQAQIQKMGITNPFELAETAYRMAAHMVERRNRIHTEWAKEQETQSNNIDLTNAFKQAINATY